MRDILFRAKRENWIELPKEEWWIEGLPSYDIDGNMTEFEVYKGFASCEFVGIDPETICEYTGLTDKNGRKIFEGDIVETVYDGNVNPNYVVVWDSTELDFKATNGKEHYKKNFEYLGCCEEIIVIGNIFDNPELIGG